MKRINKLAIAGVVLLAIMSNFGCSLNKAERDQYKEWQESEVLIQVKSPEGALFLGILPGVGSFYTGNIPLGVVDLLLWPVSVAWDGPIAANTATLKNYNATQRAIADLELAGGAQ